MGFDDRGIVALSGAHAVGRCHTDRSGFWGPWTHAENTMSNEYFRLLFEEKWTPKKTHSTPVGGEKVKSTTTWMKECLDKVSSVGAGTRSPESKRVVPATHGEGQSQY